MTPMNCSRTQDLIDLYAAGECDGPTQKEMRSHLVDCPACREKLVEARHLQAMLELHHRAPAALARLQGRIDQEAQPRSTALRFWPGASRFAAVAALLLVTFGLALWLPVGLTPREPPLDLRAELSPAKIDLAPAREGMVQVKPGVKSLLLPALSVRLRNPTNRTIFLHIENYRLDLRGPEVSTIPTGRPFTSPFPPEVTIRPHGEVSLPMDRLVTPTPKGPQYLSPKAPGAYSLTVHLRVLAWVEGASEKRRMTIKAGPMPLLVEAKE